MKGRYANMWRKQIRAERAAEAAEKMVAKANALQAAVMDRPGSSGNEGGPSEDVSENEADSRNSTVLVPNLASKALVQGAEGLQDGDSTLHGSQAGDSTDDKPEDRKEDNHHCKADQDQSKPGDHSHDSDHSTKPGEDRPAT